MLTVNEAVLSQRREDCQQRIMSADQHQSHGQYTRTCRLVSSQSSDLPLLVYALLLF